jgi:hypothetical protein
MFSTYRYVVKQKSLKTSINKAFYANESENESDLLICFEYM